MKYLSGILYALGAFLLVAAPPLRAERPYGLSPQVDIPLIAADLAMKYSSGARLAETRARGIDPASLRRGDLPAYDRWAVGFYSPRLSEASSVVAALELAVPLAVNAWDSYQGAQPWYGAVTDFVILEEALTAATALSSYAKSVRVHSTPLTYDPDVPDSEKRKPQNASSFFSNHTTTAFATAVFSAYTFGKRHPDSKLKPYVWGGSLALAAGVGSMRVLAGKHFPSDVVAGALVGSAFGYLVPRLHLGGETKKWDLGVALQGDDAAPGPMLSVRF